MDFVFNFFRLGGPIVFVLLLLGLAHFGLCVLHVVIGESKRMAPLLLASLASILCFGLLGTIHGLVMTFSAAANAEPAVAQSMIAQGISVSLYSAGFACLLAALGSWAIGVACFLTGSP